ncbi:NAD-dependent epimerase/dehydratase family protein [Candidatus Peribacteria bacterium]|nr:NAD-dependent epimerase/dehydratase family protein [Candidatus Peribacteria bacterium]
MNETKTILVTGGSGFIGTKLTQALLDKGYAVVASDLVKPKIKHERLTFKKSDLSIDKISKRYDGVLYGIIHLAGKNIFGRWTEDFKKAYMKVG